MVAAMSAAAVEDRHKNLPRVPEQDHIERRLSVAAMGEKVIVRLVHDHTATPQVLAARSGAVEIAVRQPQKVVYDRLTGTGTND